MRAEPHHQSSNCQDTAAAGGGGHQLPCQVAADRVLRSDHGLLAGSGEHLAGVNVETACMRAHMVPAPMVSVDARIMG